MSFHFRTNENFTRIVELTPQLRREIETTVEHLISILDLFDGDENLEDDDCGEPVLGWTAVGPQALSKIADNDDREEEDEHGGDILDEPHDDERLDDEEDHREDAIA